MVRVRGMEEGRYIPRADLASLRKVFLQYSTVTRDGQPFLSYEDLIVRLSAQQGTKSWGSISRIVKMRHASIVN